MEMKHFWLLVLLIVGVAFTGSMMTVLSPVQSLALAEDEDGDEGFADEDEDEDEDDEDDEDDEEDEDDDEEEFEGEMHEALEAVEVVMELAEDPVRASILAVISVQEVMEPEEAAEFLTDVLDDVKEPIVRRVIRAELVELLAEENPDAALKHLRAIITAADEK